MKNKPMMKILIGLHIVYFLIIIGLFFIPLNVWKNRLYYQFLLLFGTLVVNLSWGTLYSLNYKRRLYGWHYYFICPLTSLTQYYRGYRLSSWRNYSHSFVSEVFSKFGLRMPYHITGYFLFLGSLILGIQYFFS
tara:strand:+ start:5526 stop:5927 length:402 start_codon:yes stop_codon:yes gene_type:complete